MTDHELASMAARAVLEQTDDAQSIQGSQVSVLAGETLAAERIQQYGVSSHPAPGDATGKPEGIAIFLAGDRDHAVLIAVDDRRYRVSLQAGEVSLYDDQGQQVALLRDRIMVTSKPGGTVEVTDGPGALLITDGVVHGAGVDPFTGATYAALGNTSSVLRAKK